MIWRRDHVLLGVDEFVFGHVRAKTSLEYELLLGGRFHPPWQFILLPNCFPQPRNCVYCCVCICALVFIELGVEMGLDQLDNLVCEGTS